MEAMRVQRVGGTMEAVVARVLLGNPDDALDMLRSAEQQGNIRYTSQ